MHTIAFLSDIHANLPALEAVISNISEFEIDEIIVGGDCIGIGPYPAETLERIIKLPNVSFINGNHELVAIYGVSKYIELTSSEEQGYLEHAKWCNSQLSQHMLSYLKNQPLFLKKVIEGVNCIFIHYPLDKERENSVYPFKDTKLKEEDLKLVFSEFSEHLVGFGHLHTPYEINNNNQILLNPGSLGCNNHSVARFAIIQFHQEKIQFKIHTVNYDDTELFNTFEDRDVPDRKFIYKAFFGGRFT